MAEYRLPGLVLGVYRDGEPEFVQAYGASDLEQNVPMRRESVFEICSITKQFTAAALLLLQEHRKLCLDDPVSKHLPHVPANWSAVTLRELLHHTSGINDDKVDLAAPEWNAEVLGRAASGVFRGRGEAWEYSNLAYCLLGEVVAAVSGRPFFDFLRERIFEPLGMKHTQANHGGIVPNRVRGYRLVGDAVENGPKLPVEAGGAGALISTVDDLNRWSTALFNGDVLSPESREAMLTPGRLASGDLARPPWNAGGYGLGVNVGALHGHRMEKHAGGWDDASAQLTRFIDLRMTIVVLTNFGGWLMRPWGGEMVASLLIPGFSAPAFDPVPDPKPSRLQALTRLVSELKAGSISADTVGERLHAALSNEAAWWANELIWVDAGTAQFVEAVKQGSRELVFYRQPSPGAHLIAVGFDSHGNPDSLACGICPPCYPAFK